MKVFTTKPRWLSALALVLVFVLGALSHSASAQITKVIGSTTIPVVTPVVSSYFYGPIYRSSAASSFNYSRYAHLYTAAELAIPAGATITRVEWLKSDGGTLTGNNTFNVLMNNSSAATLTSGSTWSTITAGASSVYSSTTQTVTGASGTYWGVNLTSSFVYSGGSLLLALDHIKAGTASGAINFVANPATNMGIGNASSAAFTGSTTLSTTSYGNYRPTIRITYTNPVACSGTPTGGTATASSSSVCAGTSVSFSLSGASAASGLTYQWQSSPNNSTWTNITGATSSNYSERINATGFYRCVVSCTSSGLSANSASVQVTSSAAIASYPYVENFDGITSIGANVVGTCMTAENGTRVWTSMNAASITYNDPKSTPNYVTLQYGGTVASYLWTPALRMTAGNIYRFKFSFVGDGYTGYTGSAFVNTAPSSTGATNLGGFVASGTTTLTTYTDTTFTFTPSTTGNYFFAIGVSSNSTPWYIGFDDIVVSEITPCTGTPSVPVAAVSGSSTKCSGTSVSINATGATSGSGITYQWMSSTTSGGPYTNITGATATSLSFSASAIGTTYYILTTNCSFSGLSSNSNEISVTVNQTPAAPVVTATPNSFCGTGGLSSLAVSNVDPSATYTWAASSGATTPSTGTSVTANATVTTDYTVIATIAGCTSVGATSIGVYSFPAVTPTATPSLTCLPSGGNAVSTLNSGLSASNFSAVCTTYALRTAPSSAVTLVNGGTQGVPLSGGSLDDGGWGGIPIGFTFNYFGRTYTRVAVGTNGTVMFGTVPGYTSTTGELGQYNFSGGFPSTNNPGNVIAVCAQDLYLTASGSIRYWTEGAAPNRRFVVDYSNVPGFTTNGLQSAQLVLFETTGRVLIQVGQATSTNAKYFGLQDSTKTIGATAPNCSATPNTANYWNGVTNTIASTAPQAWLFVPPVNYMHTWSAAPGYSGTITAPSSGAGLSTVTANSGTSGLNMYRLIVQDPITTCSDTFFTSFITKGQTAPILQDSLISVTALGTTSLTLSWVSADEANGRIVKMNTTNSFTNPTDGVNYTQDTVWRNAGEQIVYSGSGTSVTITGLRPSNTYTFRVFNYFDCSGKNYGTGTSVNNPRTVTTDGFLYQTFRATGIPYNSIASTGTPITSWTGTSGDDNVSNAITFPFPFTYYGQSVSSFRVSSNGWVSLNGAAVTSTAFTNALTSNSTTQNAMVAPFWDDLVMPGTNFANAGTSFFYSVSGTAPNRVLTVEFAGLEKFGSPGPSLNFQAIFYEANSVIEFVYGNMQLFDGTTVSQYSYSTGINGFSTSGTLTEGMVTTILTENTDSNGFTDPGTLSEGPACNSRYRFVSTTSTPSTGSGSRAITNNECAGAIPMSIQPNAPTSFCSVYATDAATISTGVPACSGITQGSDVWFKITPTQGRNSRIDLRSGPGFDGVWQLYRGTCGNLTQLMCVNKSGVAGTEDSLYYLLTGVTYYIRVFHNGATLPASNRGNFTLDIYEVPTPPANDNCTGAVSLTSYQSLVPSSTQTTLTATQSSQATTCGTASKDIWYSFVATYPEHQVTVTPVAPGTTFNPAVQVFSGSCAAPTSIACQNNNGVNAAEVVSLTGLTPGATYFVRVFHTLGGAGGTGNFTIGVTNTTARNFSTQNLRAIGAATGTGTKTVGVVVKNNGPSSYSGTLPVAYTRNGTLVGSQSPTVTLNVGDTTTVWFTTTYTSTTGSVDNLAAYVGYTSEMNRSNDTTTVSYNNTVAIYGYSWAKTGGGATGNESGVAIATDANGNSVVVGTYNQLAIFGVDTLRGGAITYENDIFIVKTDTNGNIVWARSAGGNFAERVSGVAVDGSGNIFVAGMFSGTATFGTQSVTSAGSYDCFIAKYNTNGAAQFVVRYGSAADDRLTGIATNAAGTSVAVSGWFTGSAIVGGTTLTSISTEADLYFASFDGTTGTFNWAVSAGGSRADVATAVAMDGSGNVYGTGYYCNNANISGPWGLQSTGIYNMFVSKYTSSGSFVWARNLVGNSDEYGMAISTDASGSVYVGGYFNGNIGVTTSALTQSAGSDDYFLAKWNTSGVSQWLRTGGGAGRDQIRGVNASASGDVLATGYYQNSAVIGGYVLNSNASGDMFVLYTDANGATRWVNRSTGTGAEVGNGVTVSSTFSVYVTGSIAAATTFGVNNVNTRGGTDMFVTKLIPGGGTMQGGTISRGIAIPRAMPVTEEQLIEMPTDWFVFNSTESSKSLTIDWKVNREISNAKYVVEQSVDGINWVTLAVVPANAVYNPMATYSVSIDRSRLVAEGGVRVRMQNNEGMYATSSNIRVSGNASGMSMLVYPNPAKDVLTIALSNEVQDGMMSIYSMDGKLVRTVSFNGVGRMTEINVGDISNGMYLVKLVVGNEVLTQRISVQH